MRNGPAKDVLSKVKMNFRFSSAFFPSRKINDFTGCTMQMYVCLDMYAYHIWFSFWRFHNRIYATHTHTRTTRTRQSFRRVSKEKTTTKKKRKKKLKDFSFLLSSVGTFAHEHIMPEVHFNVCELFTREMKSTHKSKQYKECINKHVHTHTHKWTNKQNTYTQKPNFANHTPSHKCDSFPHSWVLWPHIFGRRQDSSKQIKIKNIYLNVLDGEGWERMWLFLFMNVCVCFGCHCRQGGNIIY